MVQTLKNVLEKSLGHTLNQENLHTMLQVWLLDLIELCHAFNAAVVAYLVLWAFICKNDYERRFLA